MLRIFVEFDREWRLWPVRTPCICDDGPGWRVTVLPFMSIYFVREKVTV